MCSTLELTCASVNRETHQAGGRGEKGDSTRESEGKREGFLAAQRVTDRLGISFVCSLSRDSSADRSTLHARDLASPLEISKRRG